MKYISFLALHFFSTTLTFAQVKGDYQMLKELNIVRSATIDGKITVGDYEVTGIIVTSDNGYLISTIFSTSFPEKYSREAAWNPDSMRRIFPRSGSVIKRDKDYKKKWEIEFKERPIRNIKNLDRTTFIIVGESSDHGKLWMARLNETDGRIIWLKDYKMGPSPSLDNLALDGKGQILILWETDLKIYYYHSRSRRSIDTMHYYAVFQAKISPEGEELSREKLQTKNKRNLFAGFGLIENNDTIFVTTLRDGYNPYHFKTRNYLPHDEALGICTLISSEEYAAFIKAENSEILTYQDGLIVSQIKSDTLRFLRLVNNTLQTLDEAIMGSELPGFSINSFVPTGNNFFLGGTIFRQDSLDDNHHKEGYLICKTDRNFHPLRYCKFVKPESTQLLKMIETLNGNLLLVGNCSRTVSGETIHYINLAEIKKE